MTTKWADGFEDSAAADLGADYTVAGTFTLVTGRRTNTFGLSQTSLGTLARTIGGTESTVFQSVACKPSLNLTTARRQVAFLEGATVHIVLAIINTGAIEVYRGDRLTLLGTSSVYYTANNWSSIQVKVVIHDTTGSVEIRDGNGTVLLALAGIDTRNGGTGYCDTVVLGTNNNSGGTFVWDDWHVWDATGAGATTWTNDTRIDHRVVDGPGDTTQFTASAGSNYQCVDDPNWNATDYVASSTAGHQDLYTFGDISHNPPNIFAVMRTAVAQKDDAGARSLKLITKRAGTIYAGAALGLNQGSYVRLFDIQATDPSTSAAWDQAGVNAAQHGQENV